MMSSFGSRTLHLSTAAILSLSIACGGEDPEPSDDGSDAALPSSNTSDDAGTTTSTPDSSTGASDAGGDTRADASTSDAGAADGGSTAGDTFYRADAITLAEPKLVAKPVLLPEQDITAQGQGILNDAITKDDDGDARVDLSLLIRFLNSADPSAANGVVTTGGGQCAFPLTDTPACSADDTFPFQDPGVDYRNAQDCQLEGVTGTAAGACFVTTQASLTMTLPILGKVPLRDAQVMGSWDGARIKNGQVRGFLPKAVAAMTRLPDMLPSYLAALTIQPGTPLTDFLSDSDLETDAAGDQGWWFRVTFTAGPATFE